MPAVLRWIALALVLVAAAAMAGPYWSDSRSFAVVALGLAILLCVVPIVVAHWRYAGAVTWLAAGLLIVWSLVLGLGLGLYLLPAGLVLVAAAAAQSMPGYRQA